MDTIDYEKIRGIIKEEISPVWTKLDKHDKCLDTVGGKTATNSADIEWLTWAVRGLYGAIIFEAVGLIAVIIMWGV